MESGSHFSYTETLEEETLVTLSISPPNLSMMLVWNNLADHHLSAFSDFARFSQTLTLKSSISSAFNDKLTMVCDSLILLDQREGEEREIRKLQEAVRPFSNNNTERPSEMLECI